MSGADPVYLWPQARIDELRELWGSGISAREIGARLGVSRNAVLGKAHRLGLSLPKRKKSRGWSAAAKERQARARIIRKLFGEQPRPPKAEPLRLGHAWEALPGTNPVPLHELTGCKWPIGQDSPYLFCNAETQGRYCQQHSRFSVGETRGNDAPAFDLDSASVDNASSSDGRFVLATTPAAAIEAQEPCRALADVNTSVRSAA